MRSPSPRRSMTAAISTSAAPSAQAQAAAEPPPGAGVASASSETTEASGRSLRRSIGRDAIAVASLDEFVHRGGGMTTVMSAGVLEDVSNEQVESFRRDGFLIIEQGFLSPGSVEVLRERFASLFEGEYAT